MTQTNKKKINSPYERMLANVLNVLKVDWAAQVTFRNTDPDINIGIARADFVLIGLDLVIEVDDVSHDKFIKHVCDEEKDRLYKRKGFEILRIRSREMDEDFDGVISNLRGLVKRLRERQSKL